MEVPNFPRVKYNTYYMARLPRKNISTFISDIKHPKRTQQTREVDIEIDPPPQPESVLSETSFISSEARFAATHMPPLDALSLPARHHPLRFLIVSALVVISSVTLLVSVVRPASGRDTKQYLSSFQEYVERFAPLLKEGSGAIKGVQQVAKGMIDVLQEAGFLMENGLALSLHGEGDKILASLDKVSGLLANIKSRQSEVNFAIEDFGKASPLGVRGALPDFIQISQAKDFVDTFAGWLRAPGERRVVVLLQNTAELRPTGGFLGSFADVRLKGANIESIEVRDINEVDRGMHQNLVPPQPLQALVKRWRIADANWFANFPDSASHIASLMESSDLYAGANIDAVLALTPRVVSDLLGLMGPIEAAGVQVDKDNFLAKIQEQVQEGQAQKDEAPKKILQSLTSEILKRLEDMNTQQALALFSIAQAWPERKDLMFYFEDERLQRIVESYGMAGAMFELPGSFNGSYLSIVDSNIGGGKSDAVAQREVQVQSRLSETGTVSTLLNLRRTQPTGGEWWYQVPSQVYTKAFTNPGAQLTIYSGGWERAIKPPLDYRVLGYKPDALVQTIESTEAADISFSAVSKSVERGKNVFGFWSKTKPGESAEVSMEYTSHLLIKPAHGVMYQFVFDRQPGMRARYTFSINAPQGYVWKETGSAKYEYSADGEVMPGRFTRTLTLQKL